MDYTVAIGINPLYVLAYTNRAYAYEAKGLKAEAIADFRRALEIDQTLAAAARVWNGSVPGGASGSSTGELVSQGPQSRKYKMCVVSCHRKVWDKPKRQSPPFRTIAQRHPILALRERSHAASRRTPRRDAGFQLSQNDVDKIIAYIDQSRQHERVI